MKLNSTQEIIDDIKAGKMVVIMDDEDRENEGDLIMAAAAVSADAINFMARYGRGLICLTLSEKRCDQLRLPLMVDSRAKMVTYFTTSIEAAEGVTTGISAADRATTVLAAVAPDARHDSIVQPGHVFPVMARQGGVLTRAGHTEAGCDLTELAGFEAAAVIVEILNEDGTMARRNDLESFARTHHLKIGTIEDLIHYRIQNEKIVRRMKETPFATDFGDYRLYAYEDTTTEELHLALVSGEIDGQMATRTSIHIQNTLTDTLAGTLGRDRALPDVMRSMHSQENGVIVFLRRVETSKDILMQIESMTRDDADNPVDFRTCGLVAQILLDLGVRRVDLMNAPKRFHMLADLGLEIAGLNRSRGKADE